MGPVQIVATVLAGSSTMLGDGVTGKGATDVEVVDVATVLLRSTRPG